MKLCNLKPKDRFTTSFYPLDAEEGDEPILTITGEFVGLHRDNKSYCVVRLDDEDEDVYEPSDLEVMMIEGGE